MILSDASSVDPVDTPVLPESTSTAPSASHGRKHARDAASSRTNLRDGLGYLLDLLLLACALILGTIYIVFSALNAGGVNTGPQLAQSIVFLFVKPAPNLFFGLIVLRWFLNHQISVAKTSKIRFVHIVLLVVALWIALFFGSLGDIALNIDDVVSNTSVSESTRKIINQVFFVIGAVCFFIGHVCYIIAFSWTGVMQSAASASAAVGVVVKPRFEFFAALKRGILWISIYVIILLYAFILLFKQQLVWYMIVGMLIYLLGLLSLWWRMATTVGRSTISLPTGSNDTKPLLKNAAKKSMRTSASLCIISLCWWLRVFGAILFIASDSFIFFFSFGVLQAPGPVSPVLIMVTYYFAQCFLSLSSAEYFLAARAAAAQPQQASEPMSPSSEEMEPRSPVTNIE